MSLGSVELVASDVRRLHAHTHAARCSTVLIVPESDLLCLYTYDIHTSTTRPRAGRRAQAASVIVSYRRLREAMATPIHINFVRIVLIVPICKLLTVPKDAGCVCLYEVGSPSITSELRV